jgi:hypothetical protein
MAIVVSGMAWGGPRVHLFVFLRIPPITGNGIPDEIPPKTAFSERNVNSNLKNGIPEIPGEIPLLSGGIPLLSGGIPDFLVENVIF